MKVSEFLADLHEVVPRFSKGRLKSFLILFAIFLFFIAISAILVRFLPPLEKYGYLGVFLANLISSMGVVVPTPPGAALTVAVASAKVPFYTALMASIGGTLGELTAYYVGFGGKKFLHLQRYRRYQTAEKWMNRYGWFAIFICSLLPLFIFDFVGIAAGAVKYPVKKFLLFCYLGRLPRALVEVYFYTWIFEHILSILPDWFSFPFVD
jgi:membrane protein YqaA with SNARE-associated domain